MERQSANPFVVGVVNGRRLFTCYFQLKKMEKDGKQMEKDGKRWKKRWKKYGKKMEKD